MRHQSGEDRERETEREGELEKRDIYILHRVFPGKVISMQAVRHFSNLKSRQTDIFIDERK